MYWLHFADMGPALRPGGMSRADFVELNSGGLQPPVFVSLTYLHCYGMSVEVSVTSRSPIASPTTSVTFEPSSVSRSLM